MSDAARRVMNLLLGSWWSQTLHAGVEVGVFEAVADGPRRADEVAEARELDPENTFRLMRGLASLGLLDRRDDGRFALTREGELLTGDRPDSLRWIALLQQGPEHYATWKHLPHLVREGGDDAFEREHGPPLYGYREDHPGYARRYDRAMTSGTRRQADALLEALGDGRLDGLSHLCDLGGGRGYLLCRLLRDHPHLTGEVLELPGVVEAAGDLPARLGVEDRVTFTAGDMLEAVPPADGYLLQNTLLDWNDENALEILARVRQAGGRGARLFVAEPVMPADGGSPLVTLIDLEMLLTTGGRQRTVGEIHALFREAGLEPVDDAGSGAGALRVVEGRVA